VDVCLRTLPRAPAPLTRAFDPLARPAPSTATGASSRTSIPGPSGNRMLFPNKIFMSNKWTHHVSCQSSAGFLTCRIADFQIGRLSAFPPHCRAPGGFGNPRYSRLGSLRYVAPAQYALLHFQSSGRVTSWEPRTERDAAVCCSLRQQSRLR
jgi:hypothetical protein